MKWLKRTWFHLSNLYQMNWSFGWEWYEKKPRFRLKYSPCDCGMYCFHLGKLWVEASWYDYKANK